MTPKTRRSGIFIVNFELVNAMGWLLGILFTPWYKTKLIHQTHWKLHFRTSKNNSLTLSWRRPLSYWNQSINLLCKSMDWFLYDNGPRHERVKLSDSQSMLCMSFSWSSGLDNRANFRKSSRSFLNFGMTMKNIIWSCTIKKKPPKILRKLSQIYSNCKFGRIFWEFSAGFFNHYKVYLWK